MEAAFSNELADPEYLYGTRKTLRQFEQFSVYRYSNVMTCCKLYPAPTFNFSSASALLCVSLAMSAGASEMPSRKSRPFALGA